ncbi:MAG: glycine cleavage system aminomethyltransferase GcvT, partial [Acidobacteria bacterium]|nr:glycine cleavage system aminomethyltransferase GcvT [Acidobacteriota bacterium]
QIRPGGDAIAVNSSSRYALLALQGPAAIGILQALTGVPLEAVRYYWFVSGEVAGIRATISRTGYTGEDGFEVFVPPRSAEALWRALLDTGKGAGLRPAGLGARDTLRLEAAMRLYGNDIDETTTVVEAGLAWAVGWSKPDFIGRDVLIRQKTEGVQRKLVGFEMIDRGLARHGYPVIIDERRAGYVTSGTQTPFLNKAIGMAYVPVSHAAVGAEFDVEIRGRRTRARVVPLPFYKRSRS